MTSPILSLQGLWKRYGETVTARDFSIDIESGEFFTMLGPSGSGKSTVLRMVAGLERPDAGRIIIDGEDMTDRPPWERRLGMVFQQYANFPHMDVAGNVGYGLKRGPLTAAERTSRVSDLLALVGLAGFERRSVTTLSGGEQQRVAIARALAPRPSVLLLDEPLSALDEKIRHEMQGELRDIQQSTGTTFLYVTHDQEEALTMSDRIALLQGGRYVQCDVPETMFRRPRTPFAARFFRGGNVLSMAGGVAGANASPTDTTLVAVRAEAIRLDAESAGCDLVLDATVEDIAYLGLYWRYRLRLSDGQTLDATRTHPLECLPNARVSVGVHRDDLVPLEGDSANTDPQRSAHPPSLDPLTPSGAHST